MFCTVIIIPCDGSVTWSKSVYDIILTVRFRGENDFLNATVARIRTLPFATKGQTDFSPHYHVRDSAGWSKFRSLHLCGVQVMPRTS